jgi:hypothetical protein
MLTTYCCIWFHVGYMIGLCCFELFLGLITEIVIRWSLPNFKLWCGLSSNILSNSFLCYLVLEIFAEGGLVDLLQSVARVLRASLHFIRPCLYLFSVLTHTCNLTHY